MADELKIVAYDPAWVDGYRRARDRLMGLPGSPFADVEHIGSTAVPGLAAKPVVDMLASVENLGAVEAFSARLEDLGYRERDAGFAYRKLLQRTASDGRLSYNLHIVTTAAWPEATERLFRDWLCAHPDVADAYADLKVALAARHGGDLRAYTDAKSDFIRPVINAARGARGLPPKTDWRE